LLKTHNISFKDYYVLTELEGCSPTCVCGCGQEPEFYRGKFRKYTKNHNRFSSKEEQYKIKFGIPKCVVCNKEVEFKRGNPNKFCSSKCSGKQTGFSLPETQTKIKQIVAKKYGVDNVSKLDEVKRKIGLKTGLKNKTREFSEETKLKHSINAKRLWSIKKDLISEKIKCAINDNKNEINRRSLYAKEKLAGRYLSSIKNRFSKLHLKIRKEMCLEQLGFSGEQKVDRFLVDELNEQKKFIIEINGDYIHANPNKYAEDDIIRLRGNNYTAQEKWFTDKIKINKLQELGYKVFIVWESDDLAKKKKELETLLQNI
jgi:G:T-mismatch repair DNA endonuclease (very short patch repair protein)